MPKLNDLTITISGPRGSGKTTVAKALFQHLKELGMNVAVKDETDSATAFVQDNQKVVKALLWERDITLKVRTG